MPISDNYTFNVDNIKEVRDLFVRAEEAGKRAYQACVPTPVTFGQAKNLFSHEIIPGTECVVDEGLCGFAWVVIGKHQRKLVNRLKTLDIGRRDVYGMWYIWAPGASQSMERKEAWAKAYAEVLREAGIRAYDRSRLD